MADNTTLNTGSGGDVIATDDIAGVKFQRVKVVLGADGVNDGDVSSANALPVSLASVPSHAVTNAGTFDVQESGAALTALQLLDDTVATTAAAITAKGIAAVGTDGTNARVLKTDTSGELQVDVLTLPALSAGTNNIGDVDVLSLPSLPAGSNSIGVLGANSGVDIGDVTINNAAGASAVNIQDGGNSITVDGTIAISNASIPVTDNAGSLTVDAPVGTPVFVTATPSATGGWSVFNATSGDGSTALTNTAQSIKASQGTFGGYYIYNPNTVVIYVCIYNVASGSVTVGTTNPAMVFAIPALAAANLEITNGIQFSTAISAACATTAAGNTAPTTALDANFWYK